MKSSQLAHNNPQYVTTYLWRLLWMLTSIHVTLCESNALTASWLEERLFLRARCKAKCLKLFQDDNEQFSFMTTWKEFDGQRTSFDLCFLRQPNHCSSNCFLACDEPPNQCQLSCAETKGLGCKIGCKLLQSILDPRPGICPVDERKLIRKPLEPSCPQLCHSDSMCPNELHKCCRSGCSSICTQPIFNASIPTLAPQLTPIISNVSSNLVDLNWSQPYSNSTNLIGPIVFILQTRVCVCKQFDYSRVTEWQTLIMTHQYSAKLEAFESGKMYQFRIAAVNVYGSRGFGPFSDPYPAIPEAPNPPSPPQNVSDVMWRFYSSGTINVLVKWMPPNHSDLPVMEYSVKWMRDLGYLHPGGQSLEGLTIFTQTIPASETQYVIEDLQPSFSYKVQIRAISYWYGHGPLESQANTIFLSTNTVSPVLAKQSSLEEKTFDGPMPPKKLHSTGSTTCECKADPNHSKPLEVQKMFYDNQELVATFNFKPPVTGLTYLLEWGPQVCINPKSDQTVPARQTLKIQGRERMLFLNNLQFGCRYVVRLRPYSRNVSPPSQQYSKQVPENRPKFDYPTLYDCFCTPSCMDVEVNRGPPPDNCSGPIPGPPAPPIELKAEPLSKSNYRLSWKYPTIDESETVSKIPMIRLTKYRIVWAPRVEEPVSKEMYNDQTGFTPIMDLQQSDARIVDKNQTWLDLHNLKEDTFYVVRIQSIGSNAHNQEMESLPTSFYFVTPAAAVPTLSTDSRSSGTSQLTRCAAFIMATSLFFYLQV